MVLCTSKQTVDTQQLHIVTRVVWIPKYCVHISPQILITDPCPRLRPQAYAVSDPLSFVDNALRSVSNQQSYTTVSVRGRHQFNARIAISILPLQSVVHVHQHYSNSICSLSLNCKPHYFFIFFIYYKIVHKVQ